MRKHIYLATALLISATATWAQTNLASEATVTEIYTPSGLSAPASLTAVTDGNTGTYVLLPNTGNDIAAISIDLTDANANKQIGTISVVQDGRHATAYTIYGTNTAPTTYDTREALNAAASSWTALASTSSDNNAGGDDNIYTKSYTAAFNSGFRYIVFVPTALAYGVSLRQIYVYQYEAPVLTTFTLAAANTSIYAGNTTTTTVTKLDQFGVEFEGTPTFTSSASAVATVGTNGVVTAVAAGSATITASLSGKTATVNITVLAAVVWPTTAPAAPTGDVHVIYNGTTGTWSDQGWGWGSTQEDIVIDGKTCRKGENLGGMQIPNNQKDYTGYQKLVVDVWSAEAHTLNVFFEGEGTTKAVALTAGWNVVNIATSEVTTPASVNYLTFRYSESPKNGILIFSNIYYSKEEAVIPLVVSVTGDVATVTGPLTAENVSEVNAATAAALFDLRGTTITGTPTINNGNPNAMILLASDKATNPLGNTTNVLYYKDNAYNVPLTDINWTDGSGDIHTMTINGAGEGKTLTYNRSIAAGKYATITLPAATAIPEGIKAYGLSTYASGTITLTPVTTTFEANTPYIIYNSNGTATAITMTSTNADLIFGTSTASNGGATFTGTYSKIAADGSQFVIQNGQLVQANAGVTIDPFRAYFTGLGTTGARLFFIEDESTGIDTYKTSDADTQMYDLQGRRVAAPAKGLYIIGGKKVLMK